MKSYRLSRLSQMEKGGMKGEPSFVQISDSHVGFYKPANPDVAATLKSVVDKINALSTTPEFILHTGDFSHLPKPDRFDAVKSDFEVRKATGCVLHAGRTRCIE